jgi:hypothetical protein
MYLHSCCEKWGEQIIWAELMLCSKGVDIDTTKIIGYLNPRLSISFEKGMSNPSRRVSSANQKKEDLVKSRFSFLWSLA